MLRVGVIGDVGREEVVSALTALGAKLSRNSASLLDHPGIAVFDLAAGRAPAVPLVQFVIRVLEAPVDSPEGDPEADVAVSFAPRGDFADSVAQLWRQRLVPYEANLRMRRRAPRARTPVLAEPRSSWVADVARIVGRLQRVVGEAALRIDHIGSTSVPGLPAKDLVDIQVTVEDLTSAQRAAESAREVGFVQVSGNWYGEDRIGNEHPEAVAVDADPRRPVNINFRPHTAPVWRDALLFRDWLRRQSDERDAYASMKRALAAGGSHVDRYSEDKMPWIRGALVRAESWAAATGWTPGPTAVGPAVCQPAALRSTSRPETRNDR